MGSQEVMQPLKHDAARTLSGKRSRGVSLAHCGTKCDSNAQKFRGDRERQSQNGKRWYLWFKRHLLNTKEPVC